MNKNAASEQKEQKLSIQLGHMKACCKQLSHYETNYKQLWLIVEDSIFSRHPYFDNKNLWYLFYKMVMFCCIILIHSERTSFLVRIFFLPNPP
jgi:hypothetical protein